jgi:hypothetical protein
VWTKANGRAIPTWAKRAIMTVGFIDCVVFGLVGGDWLVGHGW